MDNLIARRPLVLAAMAVAGLAASSGPADAASYADFALGPNAEAQACRAVWRFESARAPTAVDVYCGAWESPTGTVRTAAAGADPVALLARDCQGESKIVASGDVVVRQIACVSPTGSQGLARYGMIVEGGGKVAYGSAFPSDWAPLVSAARVTLGLAQPSAAAAPQSAQTPGLSEIQAVFPDGPPGQGAAFNYELLRRRGYEQNVAWSFGASERDFSELLRAHQRVNPNDSAGEAEILAEIALNLSDARRFGDAAELLDRAEAGARAAGDELLVTKVTNYRALDALNRGKNAEAMRLALAANAARAHLGDEGGGAPGQAVITPAVSRQMENRTAPRTTRAVLALIEDVTPRERAAVLSAQGYATAAVAARSMGQGSAQEYLDRALASLGQSAVQPAWLGGQIYEERSSLALQGGNAARAEAEAREGLARIQTLAPETRVEARLILALERAKLAQGDRAGALQLGRTAMRILERQSEAPGMPADVASGHIEALLEAYEETKDPALASEYFETLTLVWDGAASRAAAQLAARLGSGQNGGAIRAYQDAQRNYRAALAKRVRIAASEAAAGDISDAEKATDDAARALAKAEGAVRQSSPRYLELLNPKVATADLARTLGADEGYIRVVLTKDAGYGAVVTRDGVIPYRIGISATQATDLVTKVRKSAVIRGRRLPDFDLQSSRALYKNLFEPVEASIAPLKVLHMDGGGVLASMPIGALIVRDLTDDLLQQVALEQDYTGVDWLARHHALDMALGPAAFVRTRQAGGGTPIPAVVAFGDFRPDPAAAALKIQTTHGLSERCRREIERALAGLRALPQTAAEAQAAAQAFGAGGQATLGAQFTDAGFMTSQSVADASVLVLATHGVLGLSSCFAEPALLTSVGDGGDGLIEASELLDRAIKARLVVLSACDTAGGGGGAVTEGLADAGEALSGLARAFIYAGAPSVLATEWKIDASASALQTDVLLSTAAREGAPVAVALGRAQETLYDHAETAHPFFWSGFVLIGDGGATLGAAPGRPAK